MTNDTTQLTLMADSEAQQCLGRLLTRTGAMSFAQVIRKSLAVYERVWNIRASDGMELIIRSRTDDLQQDREFEL